jgi:EpsI family protein
MIRTNLWTIVVLLGLTFGFLQMRGDTDQVPPSLPLASMPTSLGSWRSQDIAIPEESLEILGDGVFLNRLYQSAVPGAAHTLPVNMFIAYFPTQRSGQSIHSPQNCLPGSGWSFESSGTTEWTDPSGQYKVGEYLISNGTSRQEVFYWYRTHGKNIANDYVAKARMMMDSILYNRTDAALIRVITPVGPGETQADAHQRALSFSKLFVPLLSNYIPN